MRENTVRKFRTNLTFVYARDVLRCRKTDAEED